MKKLLAILLSIMMLVGLTACGTKDMSEQAQEKKEVVTKADVKATDDESKTKNDSSEVKTIKVFQFKVDTVEQMQNVADAFTAQYDKNIKIEVETIGGNSNYDTTLKTKFAADEVPDMFAINKYSDLLIYEEFLMDLSDQSWIERCLDGTLNEITKDGKVYGQPLTIEAYGFVYNKDLFDQAGIEFAPTTYSELVAACEKLDAAGITPFVNSFKEGWTLGQHVLNGILLSKVENPSEFEVNVGLTDTFAAQPETKEAARLLTLTSDYGLPNAIAEDYSTAVADFAAGKAAILSQGMWIQPTLDQLNPELNLGIFGYPINDSADVDVLPIGVPGYWVIKNDTPYAEELKDFLVYLANDESALTSMVKDFKFIPPFKDVDYDPKDIGDIAAGIDRYTSEGKTTGYYWMRLPEGFISEYTPVLQAFLVGELSEEEMIQGLDDATESLRK